MFQINFYPESEKEEYIRAVREYQDIWDKEGTKIVTAIEKYSKLSFKTKIIKALVFEGVSSSRPLKLRSSNNPDMKKGTLIHELVHIILSDNNFYFPGDFREDFTEGSHRVTYLILYDVWSDLFGESFAKKIREFECGNPIYKKAWDWALSFNKEERAIKFQEMKNKYQKNK